MLKLRIYNRPSDAHSYMEVLGDVPSIFELHWILSQTKREDGCAIQRMVVTNLEGRVLDPKASRADWYSNCPAMSYGRD